ncbi:MAG TPA: FAD-dependent oxidoreductase [Bacillota bacterium]|nr:FAD-dependent oxidoreductase [Bacillota bacterium]
MLYDYIIIGAGIIGSCVARELSRYDVKTLVLEKENDVANIQVWPIVQLSIPGTILNPDL